MAKHITICAGIDTGKRKLDVALEGSREPSQVDNTSEGHAVLLAWLRRHRVNRVGIEASGGYEQPVVTELRRKRFVVVVFQPAQVRAYAKFHSQRAKNDKIDAALIAACTAAVRKIHAAPDARLLPFAEQLTMIDQIGEDIARLKNRIESCRNAQIKELWREDIARLAKREKLELKALIMSIRKHPDLANRLDLINSIDGIGLPTAVAILVRMPEIGQITREQAAALAGLAPYVMIVASRLAPATSRVGVKGYVARCTPPRWRHHSAGTGNSSLFTGDSSRPERSTSARSLPAPGRCLSSPTRSSPEGLRGRTVHQRKLP
jgi:transposase